MPIAYSYRKIGQVSGDDLLIISDESNGYRTNSVTVDELGQYIKVFTPDPNDTIIDAVSVIGGIATRTKAVTIPEGATSVDYTFGNDGFTAVTFPDTLITIQDNSFASNQLISVTIPDATTSIGNSAFQSNLLETAVIGDGVTTIGESAFNNNANLSSVTLGSSVQSIGDTAFDGCNIASITFPDSLLTIGNSAFRSNSLISVTIPNNVTSLGQSGVGYTGPFYDNNISSLTLGSSLQTIGDKTFGLNQLTSVIIPDSVTEIGREAFVSNLLTSVDLGSGVQYIRNSAFTGYGGGSNQITSITIPDSTIEIEAGAFNGNAISSLTLGSGLTTIGNSAFANNNISSLSIPSSVTLINYGAFLSQSVDITSLTFAQGTGLTIGTGTGGVFSSGGLNLTSLSIPNNTILGGANFIGNQIGALTIGNGCTIGDSDFQESTMTTVNIGNNATIDQAAFAGANMTSLTVGDDCSLTSPGLNNSPLIGSFNDITVGDIVFGDNLTTDTIAEGFFEYGPFSDNNGSGALSITGTFTAGDNINFGRRAWFIETNVIGSGPSAVTFGPNFTNGDYAFYGALTLSSFTFTGSPANTVPNGVTIPAHMFNGVEAITSLTIGDNVTIENNGFANNESVTSLTLGNNVTLNGGNNFNSLGRDTTGLDVTIPGSTTLATNAFSLAKINNLTIQSGVTEIPSGCFSYTYNTTPEYNFVSISIPSSVLTFGDLCFAGRGFPSPITLTLGSSGNPITAGGYAFRTLTSSDTVEIPTGSTYVATGTNASFGQATVNFY
mgnify:CR=1 FL=1